MPDPVEREELHHRQVDLRFYRRTDGLFEVTGHLLDTKTHPFQRLLAPEAAPAGAALHDITVRLVVDDHLVVHDASASMDTTPFAICPGATSALAALKGLHMGKGWNKRVRELLGGAASCTHIVELLGPMATTAFQGLAPQRIARARASDEGRAQEAAHKVDSCYAFGAQREVVARLWPGLRAPQAQSDARVEE